MKRHRVNKQRSARKFSHNASRTKAINIARPTRGGGRL